MFYSQLWQKDIDRGRLRARPRSSPDPSLFGAGRATPATASSPSHVGTSHGHAAPAGSLAGERQMGPRPPQTELLPRSPPSDKGCLGRPQWLAAQSAEPGVAGQGKRLRRAQEQEYPPVDVAGRMFSENDPSFIPEQAQFALKALAPSNSMPAISKARKQEFADFKALNMPAESMAKAYRLFNQYAGHGDLAKGSLTKAQFSKMLCELITCKATEQLPVGMVDTAFRRADLDADGTLDFREFSIWYSSHSFCESMNLSKEERELRSLARKHNLQFSEIEQYKRNFDEFDEDGSGDIDAQEFENLLAKCVKLPKDQRLPASRVRSLWRTADTDSSGGIDFEEFVVFYKKYFDGAGIDNLYRTWRNGRHEN